MSQFKFIDGYNNMYEIDKSGTIRSYHGKRKGEHVILKHCDNGRGYDQVGLHGGSKEIKQSVHRIVALTYLPNPNDYSDVNHKDMNKKNNNMENLEWCSRPYNQVWHNLHLIVNNPELVTSSQKDKLKDLIDHL